MFAPLTIAFVAVCCLPFQQSELDKDYQIQGEYRGQIGLPGGGGDQTLTVAVQVIALGDGRFKGKVFRDGLPGENGVPANPPETGEAELKEGKLEFVHPDGSASMLIADGKAKLFHGEELIGSIERVVRKSKTLGEKPPADATVLFGDGEDAATMKEKYGQLWTFKGKPARISKDGLLMEGASSKQEFGSHRIHVEFRLPYQPKARGQKRGNSGLYLQGRYEVQMLDSFGLEGKDNECGGIYKIRKPDVNMCYPPMQWQTYDIEFHAAKFEGDQVKENAWMKVEHNGVVIHEKVELPRTTTASPKKVGSTPGPVFLQNHGNPVRYRNIWVESLED